MGPESRSHPSPPHLRPIPPVPAKPGYGPFERPTADPPLLFSKHFVQWTVFAWANNTLLTPLQSILASNAIGARPLPPQGRNLAVVATSSIDAFYAVDGGIDRICRGASVTDSAPSNYVGHPPTTLEACKVLCMSNVNCAGLAFDPIYECQVWTR